MVSAPARQSVSKHDKSKTKLAIHEVAPIPIICRERILEPMLWCRPVDRYIPSLWAHKGRARILSEDPPESKAQRAASHVPRLRFDSITVLNACPLSVSSSAYNSCGACSYGFRGKAKPARMNTSSSTVNSADESDGQAVKLANILPHDSERSPTVLVTIDVEVDRSSAECNGGRLEV